MYLLNLEELQEVSFTTQNDFKIDCNVSKSYVVYPITPKIVRHSHTLINNKMKRVGILESCRSVSWTLHIEVCILELLKAKHWEGFFLFNYHLLSYPHSCLNCPYLIPLLPLTSHL